MQTFLSKERGTYLIITDFSKKNKNGTKMPENSQNL